MGVAGPGSPRQTDSRFPWLGRPSLAACNLPMRAVYSVVMPNTPWDAPWHVRTELSRVVDMLGLYLQRQRGRGRSPAADAVRGAVIEDGEAEGLVAELAERWARPQPRTPAPAAPPRSARAEVAARAEQGAAQGAFLPLR